MAIWDRPRPTHIQVEWRENTFLNAYGETPKDAERTLAAYAGDERVKQWKADPQKSGYEIEDYKGDRRPGLYVDYEVRTKERPGPLPELPEPLRGGPGQQDSVSQKGPDQTLELPGKSGGPSQYTVNIRGARDVVININLAQFEPPGRNPGPELREDFDKKLVVLDQRVDALEKTLEARGVKEVVSRGNAIEREDESRAIGAGRAAGLEIVRGERLAAFESVLQRDVAEARAQMRREAVEVKENLAGEMPRGRVDSAEIARGAESRDNVSRWETPEAGMALPKAQLGIGQAPEGKGNGEHHVSKPSREDATRPEVRLASEARDASAEMSGQGRKEQLWRGTLIEAVEEASKRPDVRGFVSAEWESQTRPRFEEPREVIASLERLREHLGPELKSEAKSFSVGEDGTVRNVDTGREAYIAVSPKALQERPDLARALEKSERVEFEGPTPSHGTPEREVSRPDVGLA